jgi:lipopolysaccharide biosynthesis regulator YciM
VIIELLWFLLPVAAASGWWIGRRSSGASGQLRMAHSPEYFKGLNFLLNEQQDEALEVFLRMAEVDSEVVETHLALGNLFRRRGEVDRAIRIHQNLMARPNLGSQERAHAIFELARDYMKAGLLDRSEKLFRELLDSGLETDEALRHLLDIYEREKEWTKAVSVAQKLPRKGSNTSGELIAHYYCELGELASQRGDETEAQKLAKKAVDADPDCSRASMLAAQLATAQGKHRVAARCYRRIEQHDPELLPEVIEPLLNSMLLEGNRAALSSYVEELRERHNGFTVVQAVTELLRKLDSDDEARRFFRDQLLKRPSLRGLREWVRAEYERHADNQREDAQVVLDLLNRVVDSKPNYHCKQCGFRGQMLHWQCPGCRTWNSVKPIIGVEGE